MMEMVGVVIYNSEGEEKVKVEGDSCSSKVDEMVLLGEEVEVEVEEIYSNMEEMMVMVEESSCSNKKVEQGICNNMMVVLQGILLNTSPSIRKLH